MRQVEAMGRALAKVLGLDGAVTEMDRHFDQAARLVHGWGLMLVATLSFSAVIDLAEENAVFHPGRAVALAEVLVAEAQGTEELLRRALHNRALVLLAEAAIQEPVLATEQRRRLAEVLLATTSSHPQRVGVGRFHLLEQLGRYAHAEDELFVLAQSGWSDAEAQGSAFFQRLARLNRSELILGGLDSDEVSDGMHDLLTLLRHQASHA